MQVFMYLNMVTQTVKSCVPYSSLNSNAQNHTNCLPRGQLTFGNSCVSENGVNRPSSDNISKTD